MSGKRPTFPCERCGRTFGGSHGYRLHEDRVIDRCRADQELRERGLILRAGVWVRPSPEERLRKRPLGRPDSLVQQWFGKPWRELTIEERREYRRRAKARRATTPEKTLRVGALSDLGGGSRTFGLSGGSDG